jgi:hypothetical protein
MMKNAALFALGLLAAGVWSHDSARCQTPPSPPLSLAPPLNQGSVPPAETDSVPPPTATAKGSVRSRAAKNVSPHTTEPRSADVESAPIEPGSVSPAQMIDRSPPSAKPAPDYDGFSVGIADEDETSTRTASPARSRRAKQPVNREADRSSGQHPADPGEDDKLKGRLTICRGCK